MKKDRIVKGLIVLVLGIILVSLTGCKYEISVTETGNKAQSQTNTDVNDNGKTEENITKTANENKTVENKTIINSNSQLSKEEIVKEVWINKLKEDSKQEMYELLDYKVESVKIVNFNDLKKGFPGIEEYYPGVKDSDIFATVIYSVKPDRDIESSFWLTGGGEIAGEWIEKEINLWIIEKDGEYSIESAGGGW